MGVEWSRLGSAGWFYSYQLGGLRHLQLNGSPLIHSAFSWEYHCSTISYLLPETKRLSKLIIFIAQAQESNQEHKDILRLKLWTYTPVTSTSSYWPNRSCGQTQNQGWKKYTPSCVGTLNHKVKQVHKEMGGVRSLMYPTPISYEDRYEATFTGRWHRYCPQLRKLSLPVPSTHQQAYSHLLCITQWNGFSLYLYWELLGREKWLGYGRIPVFVDLLI